MLHAMRIVATVMALAPLLTLGGGFAVRGRDWRAARHGARLRLFALELLLLGAWFAFVVLLRRDLPLLGPVAAPWAALAGALCAVGGALLAAWGRRRLGRLFSPTFGVLRDHELVTDGPYAVTRHPLYTGLLELLAGLALVWNSAGTLLFALALALPLTLHTFVEEQLFTEQFGQAYRDYQRRVPRLVPGAVRQLGRERRGARLD